VYVSIGDPSRVMNTSDHGVNRLYKVLPLLGGNRYQHFISPRVSISELESFCTLLNQKRALRVAILSQACTGNQSELAANGMLPWIHTAAILVEGLLKDYPKAVQRMARGWKHL